MKLALQNGKWQLLKRILKTIPAKMPAQADSTATTVAGAVSDFNALLTKLKTSGAMASS